MKTRLDPVVRFREQKEQKALDALTHTTDARLKAVTSLEEAKQRARQDSRGAGDVSEWALADAARERALVAVKTAQDHADKATVAMEAARSMWRTEHKQTEVVRRVAELRRDQMRGELARAEAKEDDAIGMMLYARRLG